MTSSYKQNSLKNYLLQNEKSECWNFLVLTNVTICKQIHNFWTCKRAMVNQLTPTYKSLYSLKRYIVSSMYTFSNIFLKLERYFSWLPIKSIWWEKSGTEQTLQTVPRAVPLNWFTPKYLKKKWKIDKVLWENSHKVLNTYWIA